MITPEKPRHMGRYWCWVFWEFKVDVLRYRVVQLSVLYRNLADMHAVNAVRFAAPRYSSA